MKSTTTTSDEEIGAILARRQSEDRLRRPGQPPVPVTYIDLTPGDRLEGGQGEGAFMVEAFALRTERQERNRLAKRRRKRGRW
jgi:hypothetical protein